MQETELEIDMRNVHWDDLPLNVREELCLRSRAAGRYVPLAVAAKQWDDLFPLIKVILATALEEWSGFTATMGIAERDVLERRWWNFLTPEERGLRHIAASLATSNV